jgi:hypothetical protein
MRDERAGLTVNNIISDWNLFVFTAKLRTSSRLRPTPLASQSVCLGGNEGGMGGVRVFCIQHARAV